VPAKGRRPGGPPGRPAVSGPGQAERTAPADRDRPPGPRASIRRDSRPTRERATYCAAGAPRLAAAADGPGPAPAVSGSALRHQDGRDQQPGDQPRHAARCLPSRRVTPIQTPGEWQVAILATRRSGRSAWHDARSNTESQPQTFGDPAARWDRDPSTLRDEPWSGLSARVDADMDVSRPRCVGYGANA
jgi:hypothetical protein